MYNNNNIIIQRVGSADNQFILLPQNKTTSNIVYREALTQ